MEAPVRTEDSVKARPGRKVRARLSSFTPVRFLKRYSRPWRRRGPKIGFDQPPQELKRLALPVWPASPSAWTKLRVRATRITTWIAFGLGRGSGRATVLWHRSLKRMHAARAWAVSQIQPLGDFAHNCFERVQVRVQALATRIAAQLQPAAWEATQTVALLARVQRVRRALLGLVACEWTAMAGLMLLLVVQAFRGTWNTPAANACLLIVSALSLAGLVLHAWYRRLTVSWKGLELFLCGECGELRNFSPSLPCPKCSTAEMPVFPAQVPTSWTRWDLAANALTIAGPAILGGMLLALGRVF